MAYDIWETCMLVPGLSTSACASWVQAWGSILAIFAAVGLARWNDERLQHHAKAVAIKRLRTIGANVEIVLEEFANTISEHNFAMRLRGAVLVEALQDARSVVVEPLDLQWIVATSGIRSIAAQMVMVLQNAEKHGPSQLLAMDVKQAATFYLDALKPHIEIIRKKHPGVFAY